MYKGAVCCTRSGDLSTLRFTHNRILQLRPMRYKARSLDPSVLPRVVSQILFSIFICVLPVRQPPHPSFNTTRLTMAPRVDLDAPAGREVSLAAASQRATDAEKDMTFAKGWRLFRGAVVWVVILCMSLVMEGYDIALIGGFIAMPAFTVRDPTCPKSPHVPPSILSDCIIDLQ